MRYNKNKKSVLLFPWILHHYNHKHPLSHLHLHPPGQSWEQRDNCRLHMRPLGSGQTRPASRHRLCLESWHCLCHKVVLESIISVGLIFTAMQYLNNPDGCSQCTLQVSLYMFHCREDRIPRYCQDGELRCRSPCIHRCSCTRICTQSSWGLVVLLLLVW